MILTWKRGKIVRARKWLPFSILCHKITNARSDILIIYYLLFNYISITTLHFSHKSHENDTIDPREKRSVYWFVSPSGTWSELTWVAYSSLHSVANEWLDAEY